MIEITEDPIDVGGVIDAVRRPDCGAVSVFLGTTRVDESGGACVEYLEYEAYRPMADRKLEEIAEEVKERWDVRAVSIVHRLGRVEPAEPSVAIAVCAPRRRDAFAASRYAIERIKEIVPIWKREVWSDGYVWVGSQTGTRPSPNG
ncbi:MAG: molybdenum cofactor biosynthesis protein MoaE [Rubrobacteraceae bacterium]|uniref:molybdenum cofactor biosynthesis protein MoaE n=1 Tax=Rubrobacter naiadicus TaxID=1392641 RepID=UPI00235EC2C3|nr:molybdenum cofactor biosynthesis protein MoaE [Rubrobacter naiadicus]MBX6764991.1 molybdenum cofactor biosynthesis protein MoaE [Rubrobacteraceae bacterium]MCL6437933.1 molybdenum cofactor biosynthesis protein MoaE [Rubrobacteraceae bacterium]